LRLPLAARFGLLGLALLCPALTAAGLAARDPSPSEPALPPSPQLAPSRTTAPAAPPKPADASIAITRLRVGAPPFAWTEAAPAGLKAAPRRGRRLATFITDSDRRCTVVAWARVAGAPPEAVRWSVTPPAGFALPATGLPSGPTLRVVLERPAGNPQGGG